MVYRQEFKSEQETKLTIFEFIEVWRARAVIKKEDSLHQDI